MKHLELRPTVRIFSGDEYFDRVTIALQGEIPSKKNKLRPRMGGGRGQMYDKETRGAIESLVTQARIQWGPRKSVHSPQLIFRIRAKNRRQDRDGIITTALDALKQAGVIHDDSIEFCNGRMVIEPAEVDGIDLLGTRGLSVDVVFAPGEAQDPKRGKK